jgi:hypothetical protein
MGFGEAAAARAPMLNLPEANPRRREASNTGVDLAPETDAE